MRGGVIEHGVAVALGLGGRRRADGAAGAAAIVDDELRVPQSRRASGTECGSRCRRRPPADRARSPAPAATATRSGRTRCGPRAASRRGARRPRPPKPARLAAASACVDRARCPSPRLTPDGLAALCVDHRRNRKCGRWLAPAGETGDRLGLIFSTAATTCGNASAGQRPRWNGRAYRADCVVSMRQVDVEPTVYLTSVTGTSAKCSSWLATEPSSRPRTPPSPLVPMTMCSTCSSRATRSIVAAMPPRSRRVA